MGPSQRAEPRTRDRRNATGLTDDAKAKEETPKKRVDIQDKKDICQAPGRRPPFSSGHPTSRLDVAPKLMVKDWWRQHSRTMRMAWIGKEALLPYQPEGLERSASLNGRLTDQDTSNNEYIVLLGALTKTTSTLVLSRPNSKRLCPSDGTEKHQVEGERQRDDPVGATPSSMHMEKPATLILRTQERFSLHPAPKESSPQVSSPNASSPQVWTSVQVGNDSKSHRANANTTSSGTTSEANAQELVRSSTQAEGEASDASPRVSKALAAGSSRDPCISNH